MWRMLEDGDSYRIIACERAQLSSEAEADDFPPRVLCQGWDSAYYGGPAFEKVVHVQIEGICSSSPHPPALDLCPVEEAIALFLSQQMAKGEEEAVDQKTRTD
ncbi:hypothetical protein D0Z07_6376 [Hyphodiscus hymeniophilus]|uniref:Uncharacterized protein n=1 Tax=Hyphodiscus hymeniophilus TaxID=353542 RepID=A0A9P7AUS2_9HELO|nr:hypothetical protein D0Z07_6376 [Hyphodiscus hymeniophilus]